MFKTLKNLFSWNIVSILSAVKDSRQLVTYVLIPGFVAGMIVSGGCIKKEKPRGSQSQSQPAKKLDEKSHDLEYLAQNYRTELIKAYNQVNRSAAKYHVVKVLERHAQIKNSSKEFTRLLILVEDSGLVETHAFSEPDKEGMEEGRLDYVLGKTFWVDKDGNPGFDMENPPLKSSLVSEWYVENKMPVVSFYGPGSLPILINLITHK